MGHAAFRVRRFAAAWVLSCSLVALAEPCARPPGASSLGVVAQSDEERLRFLSQLLEEESRRAHTWTLGWGATYGVMTVAQLAVMPLFPKVELENGKPTQPQSDWYWGAVSTAVGVAFTLLDPPEVLEAGPIFAQRARAVTPEGTCALIAEGERLLEAGAEHEQGGVQWYIHAANVLFNVGLGLVLGLGYERWTSGVVNTLTGAAIGEATIFTSPTQLVSGWKKYRLGEAPPAVTFQVVPNAGPGLGLLVRF